MSLAVSIIAAAVTVGLFLSGNVAAGLIAAIVGGIGAIRAANAERRGDAGTAGPPDWRG